MSAYIKNSKKDRDEEKKERKDIEEFLVKADVKNVFETYKKPLEMMFKFYAA